MLDRLAHLTRSARLPRPPRRAAALAATLVLSTAACADAPEPALRVDGVAFSEEQVAGLSTADLRLLADVAGLGLAVARDETDELVEPLVEREAERSRLRTLPYVLAARETGLDDDALRAAYARDPELELTVRHVVRLVPRWAGDAEREEAARVAREVERRARADEDFAALAAEYSEEPGAAERGGLLEPGREGSWVDPFWRAAVRLEPGQVSPVVETEYGYHVIRLEARDTVPFERAGRTRLLRQAIPADRARAAMERWVESAPAVLPDPPAVLRVREALLSEQPAAAAEVGAVGASTAGDEFTGQDLALAWAALPAEDRRGLELADEGSFGMWAENEMREAAWAAEAARLGAERAPGAGADARGRLLGRVAGLSEAAGFRQGMSREEIAAAALRAVGSGGQGARLLRSELPPLRLLLRAAYPLEDSAAISGTSSEIRNSESSR